MYIVDIRNGRYGYPIICVLYFRFYVKKLEVDRYIENIAIYRRYRYDRYRKSYKRCGYRFFDVSSV
jgi:hypothetical protein